MAGIKVEKEEDDVEGLKLSGNQQPIGGVNNTCEKTLDMLTWNTHGSPPAEIRHTIVPIVKKLLPHNIISFLQEIHKTSVSKKWKFEACVLSPDSGKHDAAVSTPESEMVETNDILLSEELVFLDIDKRFIPRMSGRTVTIKHKIGTSEYANKVLLISYHAECKGLTGEERKSYIIHFFDEMCKLADKKETTIIIGGDFNLNIHAWRDDVEGRYSPGRVCIAMYTASPRRWTNCIDTFAIVKPLEGGTHCRFIKTTAIYPFPTIDSIGGNKNKLVNYPKNAEEVWFKFVHYSDEDKNKVEKLIKAVKVKAEEQKKKVATQPRTNIELMPNFTCVGEDMDDEGKYNPETKSVDRMWYCYMVANDSLLTYNYHVYENSYPEEDPYYLGSMPNFYTGVTNHYYAIKIIVAQCSEEKCACRNETKCYSKEDKIDYHHSVKNVKQEQQPKLPPVPLWPKSPLHRVVDHDPVLTKIKFTLELRSPEELNAEMSTTPTRPKRKCAAANSK